MTLVGRNMSSKRKLKRKMAKRARVTKSRGSGGSVVVVSPPSTPARRRSSGGIRRRRSSGIRRRRTSVGGGGNIQNRMIGHAVGGFAVGFLEKSFPNLPSLPFIGRKGAIALGAYFLRAHSPILTDVALAAASISGYQLGSTGTISGDDDDVSGLAAQM